MRYAAVLRSLLYAAMALVLAGGWAVMYLQSRAADPRAASEILATLRQLGEADARWNDRLIGLRAGTVPEAEASLPPRGLGSLIANLEVKGLQLRSSWRSRRSRSSSAVTPRRSPNSPSRPRTSARPARGSTP